MLIPQLQQTTNEIATLKRLAQAADGAKSLGTRAAQLRDPASRFVYLATILEELRKRGIAVQVDLGRVASLRQQALAVAQRYQDNPQSLMEPDTDLRYKFWDELRSLPDNLQAALTQEWSHYVEATLPAPELQLLDILERLPGFRPQALRIRGLYAEANSYRKKLPQTAAQIDRIGQIANELRAAWQVLPDEGIPDDVRDFLTPALDGTARLSQLNGTVIEWLRAHNLEDSIRIALRAQTS